MTQRVTDPVNGKNPVHDSCRRSDGYERIHIGRGFKQRFKAV